MSSDLAQRLEQLRKELNIDGPKGPTLVAVSKTVGAPVIRTAYDTGQRDFGENRVQDLLAKMDELSDLPDIRWHFIGRLQRNKVRKILGRVQLIHSVSSLRLAQAISRIAAEEQIDEAKILLEVNVSGEESKAGFTKEQLRTQLPEMCALPNLSIEGLMTMAPFVNDKEVLQDCFKGLHSLSEEYSRDFGIGKELSMGMSNDYTVAIAEGATIVRIGSRIFHGG